MKFIVSATQLITQDVSFVVDVDEEYEARAIVANNEPDTRMSLYDAHDEVYLRNIVTGIRPATEEESK